MAKFDLALAYIIANEGEKFVDDPKDRGGATKYGISQKFLKSALSRFRIVKNGIITSDIIKQLTYDQAATIYYWEFWQPSKLEQLTSQKITNYIFDCCVNHGLSNGIRMAQRAILATTPRVPMIDDGIIGNGTVLAINAAPECLIAALRADRAAFMRAIVFDDIGQTSNLRGWLNRCYEL